MTTRDPERVNAAERVLARLARQIFRLPHRVQIALSGKRRVVIDDNILHPEMQLLTSLRNLLGGKSLAQPSVEDSRYFQRHEAIVHRGEPIAVGKVTDLTVSGAAGPLRARHYAPVAPESGERRPLLLFFHGGGFVFGDLDTHDAPCRALCREANVHVLAIDYRLAPEYPFPAAVDDGLAAYRWARANAATLGADPARIAIGGDSAGGNMAAVLAQDVARSGEPAPVLQLLLYPAIDRTRAWRSESLFPEGLILTKSDIDWFSRCYKPDGGYDEPRFSPLCAKDLSGLCPAIVVTAGFDPLRDEGEAYAKALAAAGNEVTSRREAAFVHGFINMALVSPAAARALSRIADELREALDAPKS